MTVDWRMVGANVYGTQSYVYQNPELTIRKTPARNRNQYLARHSHRLESLNSTPLRVPSSTKQQDPSNPGPSPVSLATSQMICPILNLNLLLEPSLINSRNPFQHHQRPINSSTRQHVWLWPNGNGRFDDKTGFGPTGNIRFDDMTGFGPGDLMQPTGFGIENDGVCT
jgi:hypothetical protein